MTTPSLQAEYLCAQPLLWHRYTVGGSDRERQGSEACFVECREERPAPSHELLDRANANEASLRAIVHNSEILRIDVFADDGAPVAGALMAAIEHDMAVQYLETESYLFDVRDLPSAESPDMTVHLVLSGPLYKNYAHGQMT